MELLTRNNFEDWMQKLMERLDRQDELLLSLRPSGKAPNPMESIRMFDNQDLCMLLQISKRTLQRYRSIGALPYKTLGKKTYYSEEDVLTFLSEHVKDFRKEDIAFYIKCYTGIVGIATTGEVACGSCISVFRPTDKAVISP